MAAYNYKGHVIVELRGNQGFTVQGYYGTFPSVKEAKQAIDAKVKKENE